MPSITLIEFNGETHTIDAEMCKSLMLNAMEHGIPGIDAA
jgi:2Fe-2S ferredoxin